MAEKEAKMEKEAKKGKKKVSKCKKTARAFCTNFCFVGVPVILAVVAYLASQRRVELAHFVMFLSLAHRTFWYNNVSAMVWLRDVKYSMMAMPMPAYLEEPFGFKPEDNRTTRICRLAMYTKWAEEAHSGMIMTPLIDRRLTLPKEERAKAFLEVCLEVIENLVPEHRKILDSLGHLPPPSQFHMNLTHPFMSGKMYHHDLDLLRKMMPHSHVGNSFPPEMLQTWGTERQAFFDALPALDKSRLKPREEMLKTLPVAVVDGLQELGLTPVRDEWIEAEDIPRALRNGEVKVFDASKLMGKQVVNLTIPDIAKLHGDMAKSIPAWKQNSGGYGADTYDSLEELGQRFDAWNSMGWQDYPEYGPFPDAANVQRLEYAKSKEDMVTAWLDDFADWLLGSPPGSVAKHQRGNAMREFRFRSTSISIPVHRLPRLGVPDMRKVMKDPDWVDLVWNLLWIGPVGDFWHFDEEDNLLMCVSGTIYVGVMDQNMTDHISGTRNIGLGFNDLGAFFRGSTWSEDNWVSRNTWIRKVPMHFLKLEPGMGITVPSRAYHNVMACDGNRILMNAFFIPKWGKAQDAPAAEHSWWNPRRQTDTFRAMWFLKVKTVFRLWDTRKIGGFFAGYKLEIV